MRKLNKHLGTMVALGVAGSLALAGCAGGDTGGDEAEGTGESGSGWSAPTRRRKPATT